MPGHGRTTRSLFPLLYYAIRASLDLLWVVLAEQLGTFGALLRGYEILILAVPSLILLFQEFSALFTFGAVRTLMAAKM